MDTTPVFRGMSALVASRVAIACLEKSLLHGLYAPPERPHYLSLGHVMFAKMCADMRQVTSVSRGCCSGLHMALDNAWGAASIYANNVQMFSTLLLQIMWTRACSIVPSQRIPNRAWPMRM